jgi:hypothetical protein
MSTSSASAAWPEVYRFAPAQARSRSWILTPDRWADARAPDVADGFERPELSGKLLVRGRRALPPEATAALDVAAGILVLRRLRATAGHEHEDQLQNGDRQRDPHGAKCSARVDSGAARIGHCRSRRARCPSPVTPP